MEEKTVRLSLKTLLRECSKNTDLAQDHYFHFCLVNRENVHQAFRYKKFNDDFTDYIACYRDNTHLIGTLRPDYTEFLEKLCRLLGVSENRPIVDDEKLTEELLRRVDRLSKISDFRKLKIEFPLLYKDLKDGRKYYDSLMKLKESEGKTSEEFVNGEHYYYSCAMKRSLPNFIETQTEEYRRFIEQRKVLKTLQETTSYNGYIREHFYLDRLYMYVMHEYLKLAESTTDRTVVKKYVELVERYVKHPISKECSLTTDEGIRVDYNSILTRLRNLKRQLADNSSIVEWILVPEGREYSRVQKEKNKPKSMQLTLDELNRLHAKGERKRTFYESTPYLVKALGLRRYHGYIAYIYENGEVLLDREYIQHSPQTAEGDAIYVLNAINFEALSKLDKQQLRKTPGVKTINHTDTWEERARKIIAKKATEAEKEAAQQLVKRLKEKRD